MTHEFLDVSIAEMSMIIVMSNMILFGKILQ